jgi:hypothetical protein
MRNGTIDFAKMAVLWNSGVSKPTSLSKSIWTKLPYHLNIYYQRGSADTASSSAKRRAGVSHVNSSMIRFSTDTSLAAPFQMLPISSDARAERVHDSGPVISYALPVLDAIAVSKHSRARSDSGSTEKASRQTGKCYVCFQFGCNGAEERKFCKNACPECFLDTHTDQVGCTTKGPIKESLVQKHIAECQEYQKAQKRERERKRRANARVKEKL